MTCRIISQVVIVRTAWARNIGSTSTTPTQAPFKFLAHALYYITMESHCKNKVQKLMAEALKQLGNQPAWWFSLNGSKDNGSSLSCLFDIEDRALCRIFVICGYCYGPNGSKFKTSSFLNFKIMKNLEVDCDKYQNSHYIRVGSFSQTKGRFTCKEQMKQGIPRPRVGNCHAKVLGQVDC